MWCLVSQPNAVILEVEVDPKAKGQECLEKVCRHLGISKEEDYFGLKYHAAKGEELWLNLRNQIDRQVTGLPPYRFSLRVKFWVPPHLILQEATRHQFYLHTKLDLIEGRLKADWAVAAKLVAYIAQAEMGDYNPLAPCHSVYPSCFSVDNFPEDFLSKVAEEHIKLKSMKPSTAEYWLLKEVSYLETFGQEQFQTKSTSGAPMVLGVGPHGVSLYNSEGALLQSIPYTAIQTAGSQSRNFRLRYLNLSAEDTFLVLKLESSHAASGLYRAVTEKHAFYSCETVRSAVTSQFIRDLKGTIISIFNEDTSLGKKYVFDIRRTCREVYDNARRALYQNKTALQLSQQDGSCCDLNSGRCEDCDSERCKASKDQLAMLMDAMICRICMDSEINTAFFPCGHVISCQNCAARCERCPVCRADIHQSHVIYLPLPLRERGRGTGSQDVKPMEE